MIRRIIRINEEKCDGCGLCASACHEGAIGIIDGKAKLLREDYCDGLGDCLPACPRGAITFEEREAPAYDLAAVLAAKKAKEEGSTVRTRVVPVSVSQREMPGQLCNWPVQIRLAPVNAPFYDGADLLIAADCTAFAHGDFHRRFIKGRVTLIGCPKLDAVSYAEKLAEIFGQNNIRSITITRMTVPCCGGLPMAVKNALQMCGKQIPVENIIIDTDGKILG